MKKFLATLLALLMLVSLTAFAEEAPTVYVSISDDTGVLVLAHQPVMLTDADADGVLTIHDALAAAHAAYHPDGTEAYLAENSEWGLSLYRLWGVENGGSYGYCVNDASAMSLLDPVAEGDHVKAYAYTDLAGWSDTYSYFAAPVAQASQGETVSFALSASGYDADFVPVTLPVADAVLTVNGEITEARTDAEGEASLTFDAAGAYVVSAVSETMTLVSPVCIVTIAE